MSTGELLLTFLVALLVFSPAKLPMLASHLGKLINRLNFYKQKGMDFWQAQLNEQQLQENLLRAKQAEATHSPDLSSKQNQA